MMADRNDGGDAFPHSSAHNLYTGMTLRDYFAGQALVTFATGRGWPSGDDFKEMATRAYGIADAMLAERSK
jgi:hypothetical protein